MSEFRQDPVTGRWVIIASQRNARPRHISYASEQKRVEPCPFCAGHEAMTPPEVWADRDPNTPANAPGWRVRVVPNKYPALEINAAQFDNKDGFYRSMNGAGVHEVIIESAGHMVDITLLDKEQWLRVLSGYRARLRALKQNRWHYVMVYKNHGERAGATFEHVHSQVVALPFVPREAQDEIDGARRHFDLTGHCIYCDIIQRESERGQRVVSQTDRFVALCPFAPRFGYETWILPKSHAGDFEQISDAELAALADSLRALIAKLNAIVEYAPFNFVIHTAPNAGSANQDYHWHMEILPQITRAAGFEWGTGVHMNSVAPEDAARLLRDRAL
jgi:UDPglucose--hexose-1-phosphate uridylyltransferase